MKSQTTDLIRSRKVLIRGGVEREELKLMVERGKEKEQNSVAKMAELKMLKLAEMQVKDFKKLVENERIKIADAEKGIGQLGKTLKKVSKL